MDGLTIDTTIKLLVATYEFKLMEPDGCRSRAWLKSVPISYPSYYGSRLRAALGSILNAIMMVGSRVMIKGKVSR